ncbi:Transcriptional regulator, GntR family [Candidatus Rhodobacter oscarellae]|uniref:Transcriptional regulator, GntR family n=1 Tax=Candidatus Rhodobacter oscarellae TaxID=1675527 RepID=A0A0J9E4K8_9RHOB|nr:GntR family transcriptional regulator [Candidatus Rhodobacter lobularis]KMW57681.1 Transcriptional regulator, GntR family [Candidatus Rhodobacter lobularis]
MDYTAPSIPEDEKLASKARRAIEDEILSGRLLPGTRLDERLWAERLGISRTPVREAIRELSSQGMVDAPPRQQAYVRKVEGAELAELFEALIGLETLVAELAGRRISDAEIATLEVLQGQLRNAMKNEDSREFQDLNVKFHFVIAQASANTTLLQTLKTVRLRVSPYRSWLFEKLDRMPRSIEEHDKIIAALRARDSVLVRRLTREHEMIDSDRLFDFFLTANRCDTSAGVK